MLLIVVRLNYMSALYFSSISFTAHKKHGGVWSHRLRTGLPPKSFRRTEAPPQREARSGGADMSEDDLGAKPLASPMLTSLAAATGTYAL